MFKDQEHLIFLMKKVSFIEALGIAGDVNITANINEVVIYREINDSLTKATIDLNKEDIFYSEYFMLKQNDIIYVPPNKAKQQPQDTALYIFPY